jgi:EVE domain
MASWMAVTSTDNFERTRALGATMQGFKTRQRKNVMERMEPGDRIVWYLTKVQAFGGTATVASKGFEDHELIWRSKPGEDYVWRVKLRGARLLEEDAWVPSHVVGPGLEYVQKWPAEHWKLAFQGNLHQIPDVDYDTLAAALDGA